MSIRLRLIAALAVLATASCQSVQRAPSSSPPDRRDDDDAPAAAAMAHAAQVVIQAEAGIQAELLALNQAYGELFARADPLDSMIRGPRFAFPSSDAAKTQKAAMARALHKIRALEGIRAEAANGLRVAADSSPSLWVGRFPTTRVRGVAVQSDVPLYLGPVISKPKPANLDSAVGDLGQKLREACTYEKENDEFADGMDMFMNTHLPSMTCAFAPASAKLIADPVQGLNEKIEMLTGAPLPASVIEAHDPDLKLDFINAPKLDRIFVTYLEFKNAFAGHVIAQALAYHAAQGALVRIILPGLPLPGTGFVQPADQRLLDQLVAGNPSRIFLQKYRYAPSNGDAGTLLRFAERTYHAKLLITLSSADPSRSAMITGGRNIKDTFYLRESPDYSKWPEMTKYGTKLNPYIFFRDLEVSVHGHEFAEQAAAQVMAFWHRERKGPKARKVSLHVKVPASPERLRATIDAMRGRTMVRHFYAVPYIDDHSIEQLYVTMLNSARTRARIVSAYVQPTKPVAQASRAAARRGVNIEFITGFDFSLDNSPGFTGDSNKIGFASLMGRNEKDLAASADGKTLASRIKFYQWHEIPDSILHSKAMLIDDDLLYVGSGNMNRRTFREDIENGLILTGPVVQEFKTLYDKFYLPNAQLIEGDIKAGMLNQLIIKILNSLNVT